MDRAVGDRNLTREGVVRQAQSRRWSGRRWWGITAIGALGVLMWPGLGAGAAAPAAPAASINGPYRLTTTDCYLSGGRCTGVFDVVQTGTRLADPSDRYFRGHVNGRHVDFGEVYPPGTSEDGWWCVGTTSDGGRIVRGTMTDGIGGSGTFVFRRLGS